MIALRATDWAARLALAPQMAGSFAYGIFDLTGRGQLILLRSGLAHGRAGGASAIR